MQRIKNLHEGQTGVVIFGGPSLLASGFDFDCLRNKGLVTITATKALSPHTVRAGLRPDYHLMTFPEDSKDNSLHRYIFRSFLAQVDIRRYLKSRWHAVLDHMLTNFDTYIVPWRLHRGPHKRYDWKKDVFLEESPMDMLRHVPAAKVIANRELMDKYFPSFPYDNPVHYFTQSTQSEEFELKRYFTLIERGDEVLTRHNQFINSSAIVLYPLLRYMGFEQIYLLGMDLTMLGSMEYSAQHVFKSMFHFKRFFRKTAKVFNADYVMNKPYYFRPPSEFDDLRGLLNYDGMRITRVYDAGKYVAPVDGIPTIPVREFQAL